MKRKARKMPKEHKNLDLMKPLIFEKLGSANDPCFGNYSAKAPECKRCGDSEVCAAITSNKLLTETFAIEEKLQFKDNNEGKLVDKQNLEIAYIMVEKSNKKEGLWLSIKKLIPNLIQKFNLTDKDADVLFQRCIKAAKENPNLKLNKKLTKYKLK